MNKWLFHQSGFTRTSLSTIVSQFVEEIELFLFTPGARLLAQHAKICQSQYMFKAFV